MTDVPEADAIEQRTPLQPGTANIERSVDPEVPEADAVEQSQVVADDEYDRPR